MDATTGVEKAELVVEHKLKIFHRQLQEINEERKTETDRQKEEISRRRLTFPSQPPPALLDKTHVRHDKFVQINSIA